MANTDSVRVELYLGKAKKEVNKLTFDKLSEEKTTIESALGTSLIWNRGDDIKASKIYCQLDNVSIEKETDWLQMASFQAEWSKKFIDVLVPYLKVK